MRIFRRAVIVGVSLALLAAGPSAAAKRYASPAGVETEPCDLAKPCSLTWAIEKAKEGDEVEVLRGAFSYALTKTIMSSVALNVHGPATGAMPEIDDNAEGNAVWFPGVGTTVSRLHLVAGQPNDTLVYAPSKTVFDDVLLEARAPKATLAQMSGGVLRDSVLSSTSAVAGAVGINAVQYEPSVIRNDTVSLPGEGSIALRSYGNCFPSFIEIGKCDPSFSYSPTLNVANTILRGGKWDIEASGPGSYYGKVQISHSNYRLAKASELVAGEISDLGGNQTTVEPTLTSDFHELAGSVTVDAGALATELGSQDPDGTSRMLGSAPDIGAYELIPPPKGPVPPAPAPMGPGPGTPPGPGIANAAGAKALGAVVSQLLGCSGQPGQSCRFTITLTITEHLAGSQLKGVSARARVKLRTKRVTVGTLTATLQAGQAMTVKVALNSKGKRLLKRFHRLPVTVTTSTTSASGKASRLSTRRLTLTVPRKRAHKH
jgi:hypothetical protein